MHPAGVEQEHACIADETSKDSYFVFGVEPLGEKKSFGGVDTIEEKLDVLEGSHKKQSIGCLETLNIDSSKSFFWHMVLVSFIEGG